MNYRHIYHAGNFADVMKHMTLVFILEHLKKKETPFCVIDAHGGIGVYDLNSIQSQKTLEWEDGIGRFEKISMPDDFKPYYTIIENELANHVYLGSPIITAKMLRPQDRLVANELHPDDFLSLQDHLHGHSNIRLSHMDAYECIRANIPPKEKRGLVLIDPPFEKKDEFETLIVQMKEWEKRFANGIFMIWYPIKSHLNVNGMKKAAKDLNFPRTWFFETMLHPAHQKDTFNGCGVVVFNTPFMVPERVEKNLPYLSKQMGLLGTDSGWITTP